MTRLLVVHDLGASGGQEWAEAFGGWPGPVEAPDLPGHGTEPAPVGGHHEVGDAVFALADRLDGVAPVVVGVGVNGHSARMIALGGRAAGLVLVDGLGGPWLDVPARNAALRAIRRRIIDTPEAIDAHHPPGTDPRATMVLAPSDRRHVVDVCTSITVPALVVETSASRTPDAADIVAAFADAVLVRLDEPSPALVADAVTAWWTAR